MPLTTSEVKDPLRFLKSNKRLPSPPGVAVRILRMVESENVTLNEIASVISTDPVLTAKILKYVHSPLVGLGFRGSTIQEAVALIGMRGAQMIALSFSLISARHRKSCPSFNLEQFWSESIARAVAARALIKHLGREDPEDAFTTALLCRLGQLLYATGMPKEYEALLHQKLQPHLPLEQLERETFGLDHIELAAGLLQEWQLPPTIWETVLRFARGELDDSTSLVTRCLPVADAMAAVVAHAEQHDSASVARVAELAANHLELPFGDVHELLKQVGTAWQDYGRILSFETGSLPDLDAIRDEAEEQLEALRLATQIEVNNLRSQNEQLNRIAQRDHLTGLSNRGAFDEALREAFAQSRAQGQSLTLLMVDIDHFKNINDNHGHPAGDGVLQLVAETLNQVVRHQGMAYRYGGEEFAIVVPNCANDAAHALAESARTAIERLVYRNEQLELSLTVSVGGAVAHSAHNLQNESALVDQADRNLYAAKNAGRNTCRFDADDSPGKPERPRGGVFSRLGRILGAGS